MYHLSRAFILKTKARDEKGGSALPPICAFLSSWLSSQLLGKALLLGWVFSGVRSSVGKSVQRWWYCSRDPDSINFASDFAVMMQFCRFAYLYYTVSILEARWWTLHATWLYSTGNGKWQCVKCILLFGPRWTRWHFQGSSVCLWIRSIFKTGFKAILCPRFYRRRLLGH